MSQSLPTGYVIAWTSPATVAVNTLRAALTAAARDPQLYAPDLKPLSRLARATQHLTHNTTNTPSSNTHNTPDRKLARPVNPRARQITTETEQAGELAYARETIVKLDDVNNITTTDPRWQRAALDAAQHADNTRTANDVTRIIQRIVDTAGSDLIAVRPQGGCYFVPLAQAALLESLNTLLTGIGGTLTRFAVTIGHGSDESISNTVAEYLLRQIAELNQSIDTLTDESSAAVKARRVLEVGRLRTKLDNYATLLGAMKDRVNGALAATDKRLAPTPTPETTTP